MKIFKRDRWIYVMYKGEVLACKDSRFVTFRECVQFAMHYAQRNLL